MPDPAVNQGPAVVYLAVSINGNAIDDFLPFTYQENDLWATHDVLRSIGFKDVEGRPSLVRLTSIAGTAVDYDVANQAVAIRASLSELSLAETVVNTNTAKAPIVSGGNGLLLNYDLYSTRNDKGAVLLSAASEFRVFNSAGVFSNTSFTQTGRNSETLVGEAHQQEWNTHNVRLDTSWRRSWADRAVTLTAGDTTTGGLAWSRATRIGGIRLGRNFALQPYRTTAPLPAFLGNAVVPSAVDLYIDGVKRYNGVVPAGPFQLNSLPSITGRGTALVVLTDAAGRQTQIDIPFYAASTMLEEGLSDWSIETGYVREEYGLSSFSYANKPLVMGTLRYGVTKSLTLETHAETSSGTKVGGVGAVTTMGDLGQFSGSYSASVSGGRRGSQYSLGYQWVSRHFNVGANTQRTRGQYRDVAAMYADAPPEVTESVVAGTSFDNVGSVNVNYVRVRYSGQAASRYAGAFWSRQVGNRVTVSASYNRNLDDSRDSNIYVGLSISLDGGISTFGSMQRSRDETSYNLGANRSVPSDTGWGWSINGQRTPQHMTGGVQVDYRGQSAEYRAGMTSYGTGQAAYAGAAGSLAAMGGSVFSGRRIYDSFAVVSTEGVPDVPVSLHNNVVGRTDKNGLLMVSPLTSYQKNLISINPVELPVNVKIDRVAVDVATREKAGTFVSFGIAPIHAASVVLHDGAGSALPLGAIVKLNDAAESFLVGYDGMAYLEGLSESNTLMVTTPGGTCRASFNYQDPGDGIAQIGPLRCE